DAIERELPELPDAKKARFLREHAISAYDADVLVAEKARADYYEAMVKDGAQAKAAAKWLINEVMGRLNKQGLEIEDVPVSAQANSAIVQCTASGQISGKMAKEVLDGIWQANASKDGGPQFRTHADVQSYISGRGLQQVTDQGEIAGVIDQVIAAN